MPTFAERLKELRKKNSLTQKSVADAVGMSDRNYQDLEYGKIKPSYDNIIKLADFFEVTTDYLLGRTDCKASPCTSNPNDTAKK